MILESLKFAVDRGFRRFGLCLMHRRWCPRGTDSSLYQARNRGTFRPDRELRIFDVGANVGQTSRVFLSEFPNSIIDAFEPVPSTFDLLEKGFRAESRVSCHPFGMSSKQESRKIEVSEDSCLNSVDRTVSPVELEDNGVQIQLRTLDDFVAEHGIESIDILNVGHLGP